MTDSVLGLSMLRSLGFKQPSQAHLDIQFDNSFSVLNNLLPFFYFSSINSVVFLGATNDILKPTVSLCKGRQ